MAIFSLASQLFFTTLVFTQDSSEAKHALNRTVCFFSCSNTASNSLSSCSSKKAYSDYDANSKNVNPYELIFDSLLSVIAKEQGANYFNPVYFYRECKSVCSAASALDDVKEQIVYFNHEFLNQIKLDSNNKKWIVLGVFAHEIGHHIFGHTSLDYSKLTLPQKRTNELRADFFCGFILSRIPGCKIEDAVKCLSIIDPKSLPSNENEELNHDYPTLVKRDSAIKDGFKAKIDDQASIDIFRSDEIFKKYALESGRTIAFRILDKKISTNNLKDAQKLVEKELQKNPNDATLLNLSGIIKGLQGDNKEAIKKINSAVSLKPSVPVYHENLAEILSKGNDKDKEKAIQEYKLAIKLYKKK